MNFFTNRIVTKSISLKDAAAVTAPKVRSLDELLKDLKSKNEAVVKTASAQVVPAAEVKKEEPKVVATAAPAKAEEPKVAETKVVEAKKEDDVEVVEIKEVKKPKAAASAPNITMKVAKKLDFRAWEAEDIVKAWGQHGDVSKCIENVAGQCSDPKTYCGLLQVANNEATKIIKASSAKATKTASAAPAQFIKISKMNDKDKAMLAKYYTRIYGKDYVDALLEDY